jgi:hypothetical protein
MAYSLNYKKNYRTYKKYISLKEAKKRLKYLGVNLDKDPWELDKKERYMVDIMVGYTGFWRKIPNGGPLPYVQLYYKLKDIK